MGDTAGQNAEALKLLRIFNQSLTLPQLAVGPFELGSALLNTPLEILLRFL